MPASSATAGAALSTPHPSKTLRSLSRFSSSDPGFILCLPFASPFVPRRAHAIDLDPAGGIAADCQARSAADVAGQDLGGNGTLDEALEGAAERPSPEAPIPLELEHTIDHARLDPEGDAAFGLQA